MDDNYREFLRRWVVYHGGDLTPQQQERALNIAEEKFRDNTISSAAEQAVKKVREEVV